MAMRVKTEHDVVKRFRLALIAALVGIGSVHLTWAKDPQPPQIPSALPTVQPFELPKPAPPVTLPPLLTGRPVELPKPAPPQAPPTPPAEQPVELRMPAPPVSVQTEQRVELPKPAPPQTLPTPPPEQPVEAPRPAPPVSGSWVFPDGGFPPTSSAAEGGIPSAYQQLQAPADLLPQQLPSTDYPTPGLTARESQDAPGVPEFFRPVSEMLPPYYYRPAYYEQRVGAPIAGSQYAPPGYEAREYQDAPGVPEFLAITPPVPITP